MGGRALALDGGLTLLEKAKKLLVVVLLLNVELVTTLLALINLVLHFLEVTVVCVTPNGVNFLL